jgi:hypothetical protein
MFEPESGMGWKKWLSMLTCGCLALPDGPEEKPNTARKPPPPATPLSFPSHEPKGSSTYAIDHCIGIKELQKSFLFSRARGISPDLTLMLNVKVDRAETMEALIPCNYLPKTEWEQAPSQVDPEAPSSAPPSSQTLSNGAAIPGHEAYWSRRKELAIENDSAYVAMARTTTIGQRPAIRLSHYRNFYRPLKEMGTFWDTSKDKYEEVPPESQATNVDDSAIAPTREIQSTQASTTIQPPSVHSQKYAGPTITNNEKPTVIYTGLRTSTGSSCPPFLLKQLVSSFLEPTVWLFGCTIKPMNKQPRITLGDVVLKTTYSHLVYRTPKDQNAKRMGMLEGPVCGVSCRREVDFSESENGTKAEVPGNKAMMDLLQEIGVAVLLAQERDREGKAEKLYMGIRRTHAPTFSFGTAVGEPFSQDDNELLISSGKDERVRRCDREEYEAQRRRRVSYSRRQAKSVWDPKVRYIHVGRVGGREEDDLYVISAINHHVSILKVNIHPEMLKYLQEGGEIDMEWYGIGVQRTRWFDLFDKGDRVEAMRGFWGLMGWMMRDV